MKLDEWLIGVGFTGGALAFFGLSLPWKTIVVGQVTGFELMHATFPFLTFLGSLLAVAASIAMLATGNRTLGMLLLIGGILVILGAGLTLSLFGRRWSLVDCSPGYGIYVSSIGGILILISAAGLKKMQQSL